MRQLRIAVMMVVATLVVSLTGCDNMVSGESRMNWDRATATSLGIAAGPITADQAKMIAERSTGGTAVTADLATAGRTEVYAVGIQTGSSEFGISEQIVHVRVSDGAVLSIDEKGGCNRDSDD